MSFIYKIPNETWSQILQNVPRSSIYQCTRVNQIWKKIATPLFYQTIILSGDAVIRLRAQIEGASDIDSLMTLKKNCGYVTTLIIKDEPFILDIMPALFVFLFTNLKSIDFSKSYFRQEYMNFFIDCPSMSCLKYIEEIFPPREASTDQIKSYYELCRRYKNSLIKFPTDFLSFKHPSEISHLLPNFSKLTHLFIQNNQDHESDIFSLINFCPSLIAFEFSTNKSMGLASGTSVTTALSQLHQNLNTKGSLLRVLDLSFQKMTADYFEYFTIGLSAYRKLQTFSLHLTNQSIYEWVQGNNLDTLLQCASILRPIDNLDIQMSINKESTNETPPVLTRDSKIAFLDKYWAFINCLKGDQWLDCLTSLIPKRIPYQHIDHIVTGENSRMHISDIEHQYWDYLSDQKDLNITEVSGEGSKTIDCLDFNNVPISEALDVLNFALIQCPQLAQLSIVTGLNSISFSIIDVDCHAKDINVRSEAVGDKIINKASIRNCSIELTEGIMSAINTHLPGIQEIEIIDFHSKSYDQEIDLSGVTCLDNLMINNTTQLDPNRSWCLVIGIDDCKNQVQYYISQTLKSNPRLSHELFNFEALSEHHLEKLCDDSVLKQELMIKCQKLEKITFKTSDKYEILNINSS